MRQDACGHLAEAEFDVGLRGGQPGDATDLDQHHALTSPVCGRDVPARKAMYLFFYMILAICSSKNDMITVPEIGVDCVFFV